jgi:hypothetical protein
MSQAFVRENEDMSLQDVSPSITALIIFLTRENNGIRVYEKHKVMDLENNRQVHVMSNGLSYSKNDEGKWYVI